jgi:hydroxymethylglutaryl-CoA lyase
METVKLVECPRDAWQGLPDFIPTEYKVAYLQALIAAGFKHIDAVSFVSPKHVKQMSDSEEVMSQLAVSSHATPAGPANNNAPEIIGIVVNEKGLERALATPGVTTIGYPYSISAYFRRANANMTRAESRLLVEKLKKETAAAKRGLVIYISMAFGNPYDEPWGPEIVAEALEWLKDIRINTVSLADTVGAASPQLIADLYSGVKDHVAGIELGVHLHSRPENAEEKILAAYEAGCRRFDSALTGLGGCPFAGDTLVGNLATEDVLAAVRKAGGDPGIDPRALAPLLQMTDEIRSKYAHAPMVQ